MATGKADSLPPTPTNLPIDPSHPQTCPKHGRQLDPTGTEACAKANLLEREGNHRPPEVPQMPLMLSVDELDGVLYAARMIAIDG